ncbi:GAL4-like Zn(II)2Cys6 (or C6 zinc) binuclear cluster DNA-binding domain [Teratosphaeria destructans]|uniref:GAL4-like Zn(II)2Cys6 (Or C6 zinc) binuclear cluster DNA-binding domain n=1 Tax=Teratosphaeria destructans TaxID=418781 RepID=A0A9W7VZ38_9PEZI|nr:GAL4-like Zn(II)2Cys6 (or C6 zinc) binuclear cluster DNA-binding domain [Teratosphaeria destructans]
MAHSMDSTFYADHECNEGRPQCSNCVRQDTICEYANPASTPHPAVEASNIRPRDAASSNVLPALPPPRHSVFDALDLAIMHHYSTMASLRILTLPDAQHCWQNTIPRYAQDHVFLMHGILALAALDMSRTTDSEQRMRCRTRALHHQQAGLAIFQGWLTQPEPSARIEAIFAFSCILIIITFATPGVDNERPSINGVLDVIRLYRGPKVMASKSWHLISTSDISPLLGEWKGPTELDFPYDLRVHFDNLNFRLEDEDDNQAWTVLMECIARSIRTHQETEFKAIGTWPALMSSTFFDRLQALQGQALVMLAQFSFVLRRFRFLWWLDGWDSILLQAVDQCLTEADKRRFHWSVSEMQRLLDFVDTPPTTGTETE